MGLQFDRIVENGPARFTHVELLTMDLKSVVDDLSLSSEVFFAVGALPTNGSLAGRLHIL